MTNQDTETRHDNESKRSWVFFVLSVHAVPGRRMWFEPGPRGR